MTDKKPAPEQGSQKNLAWAASLIKGLVASGVKCFVLSPGSRSTPLVFACQQNKQVKTWVIPDERSAAFFALGVGKALGSPVGVISTSGSAPANWYPAVIEASQDAHPLILLSADRPAELQQCGANQTIDQVRLFGPHVREFFALPTADDSQASLRYVRSMAARAADLSRWPYPGPVHINCPFREPLVPAADQWELPRAPASSCDIHYAKLNPAEESIAQLSADISGKEGVIVCGRAQYSPHFAEAGSVLAKLLLCPVMADPLSGLRFGPHDRSLVLTHYDAYLRNKNFVQRHQPTWVLQFGGSPTSKFLQHYLQSIAGNTIIINAYGGWPDPAHRAHRVIHADPLLVCQQLAETHLETAQPDWCAGFLEQERLAAEKLTAIREAPFESLVLQQLSRHCPSGTSVFCANSMVIRDVDSFVSGGNKKLTLVGNRGASGIDGNVSTVLGMAAVADGPVVGLLGDLALYHDMNGLLAARENTATLVIFNNGGGAIFSYLPQAQLPDFERYWQTPTGLSLSKVAQLYALKYHSVHDIEQFETALTESLCRSGVDLIEIIIDHQESVHRHKMYWQTVIDDE